VKEPSAEEGKRERKREVSASSRNYGIEKLGGGGRRNGGEGAPRRTHRRGEAEVKLNLLGIEGKRGQREEERNNGTLKKLGKLVPSRRCPQEEGGRGRSRQRLRSKGRMCRDRSINSSKAIIVRCREGLAVGLSERRVPKEKKRRTKRSGSEGG